MKTRIKTILLIFSATLTLSLLLFAELASTANAVAAASQSILDAEAASLGTQAYAPAAVDATITINKVGGDPVCINDVTKDPNQEIYNIGDEVTLRAVPDPACLFDHWDGAITGTLSPKPLTVDGSDEVWAYFEKRCFKLTLSHTGSGGDPIPDKNNSTICPPEHYVVGEEINLSAFPELHWMISSWTGSDGTNPFVMPLPLDLNTHVVTVNYTPICYTLSTSVVPAAAGIISRTQGPNCPAPGPATQYLQGTVETLTATAYDGYGFLNWSGGATGTLPQTTVTMNSNHTGVNAATANFAKACLPLFLSHAPVSPIDAGSDPQANPSNSTGCNPGEYVFDQSISLQNANPIPGWRVDSWEGTNNDNSTSSSNSLTYPRLPATGGSGHYVTVNYIQKPTLDFSAATYTINEDAITATISVKRSGSLIEEVTVLVKSSDDTATAGQDYVAVNETLTFPSNNSEQTFTVQILDDPTSEGTESLTLSLSAQSAAAVLGPQATADLIILDDEGGSTVQFSSTTYTAPEISSSTMVTISLFPPSASNVFVQFNTSAGTATNGEDYLDNSELIPFWPGDTIKLIPITLIDDTLDEFDETIQLQLPFVQGAGKGASDAILTILDDDESPSVQFSTGTYFAKEGAATAPLTVTLSAATSLPVTVDYTVLEIANNRQTAGQVIFSPGEITQVIDVPIDVNQADDTLNALLNGADNASLASPSNASLIILAKDRSDCYNLTLNHTGYGGSPIATNMTQSIGCPAGQYVANDLISLRAHPDLGWTVDGWHGTLNDNDTVVDNVVRMPDGDHTVNAYYITSAYLPGISNIYIDYFEGPGDAEPNDALDTSKANGPIRSGKSYLGNFPAATDKWDIFFFTLATKGNIQIDLTNIPAAHDYNLYLFANNENKDIVGYSGSLGNLSEHISNSNLDPGLYFVAVHSASGTPTISRYSMIVIYE